jgi:hypothetical protein
VKVELCCECQAETGRAGIAEDSLYAGGDGPYCEECWNDLREILAARINKLFGIIADIRKKAVPALSPMVSELADAIVADKAAAVAAERERCAKLAGKAAESVDCDRLGFMDMETGVRECSLEVRGSSCLCVERQEAAEAIAVAIREGQT